ncbi:hypothetical protein L0U85_11695 [Glycomyces sp. L485]|uniref:hypothetical protein n=1 Tax=Glycomyces sp. L485 TaxID=2909235 RepID=UPI001F4A0C00|nr:hypothetical protein [Glycomyces sp. L485]MCH7231508.1 hypothetical protein [Glycomyces sp. L485]
MTTPPEATGRRAITAAVWLAVALTGLITAAWAVGWALSGGSPPSLATVAEATHLHYPDSTDVLDADLAELHTPTPGSRGEATVEVPAGDFGDFIAGNDMDAPLVSGTTPTGAATGIIPSGCTTEICYSATLIVDDDAVTVDLRITLI